MTDCHAQRVLHVLGEAVDAGPQRLLDGVRHRDRRRVGLFADGPAQLLEEERVALRLAQDRGGQGVLRPAGAQQRLHDALAVAPRQRLERELGRIGLVHPRRPVAGPVRQEREDGRARRRSDQGGETLLRGAVDPLEVLAHEHDRPLPAPSEAHLTERVHRPGPAGLAAQHAQPLGALLHAQEIVEVRGPLLRIHLELLEPRAHLPHDRRRTLAVHDADAPPQDRDDRQIGHGAPIGEAMPVEPRHALAPEAPTELEEEPRLPDPGLAHDADHLAVAVGGGREAIPEELELVAPPRQGRQATGRSKPGPLDALEPVRGRVARSLRAEGREGEPAIQERRGRVRDDGPVRVGPEDEALQRLPGAAFPVELEPDVAARVAHQEGDDVDAQPHRDPARLGAPAPLHRPADRQGRVGGAARGIFDRLEAERRHDAGGPEVLHAAAEAPRLLDELLDEAARIEAVVVRRGPVDHGAQEGHATLLPADRGRRRVRGNLGARGRRPRRFPGGLAGGRGTRAAGTELMLGDPVAQGVPGDSQSARRAGDVPEGLVEGLEEPGPLDRPQRRVERGSGAGAPRSPGMASGAVDSSSIAAVTTGASTSKVTRSIVLMSSRTLPGHECWRSAVTASGANRFGGRPYSTQARARKCSASRSTSGPRSRRGGRIRVTTARRW